MNVEAITRLTQYDWFAVFLAVIVALIAFKYVSELFEWFIKKFGIETKNMRDKKLLEKTAELANSTAEGLKSLEEQYKTDEQDFRNKLEEHIEESRQDRATLHNIIDKLANIIVDSTTHSMRWEILKFGADLSNGRKYNSEAFNHVLKTYDKYENILKEYGLKNGLAEDTISYIREVRKEELKNKSK